MSAGSPGLRRSLVKATALVIVAVLYGFARLPSISDDERRRLAGPFRFTRFEIPEPTDRPHRTVRAVHPSVAHIASWISSVGASVALADVDGDGLSNELCYVHTGTDRVLVTPVPGTGERFAPFELDPAQLRWDETTMAPMGCLPGDFNEDGLTDVLVYFWGRTPIVFLQRLEPEDPEGSEDHVLGGRRFRARELVSSTERWFTNAATRADVDGDGHVDLILGNYFADGSRILDSAARGREAMQSSMSRAANGGRNRILLWAGASVGEAPTVRFSKAPAAALPRRAASGWTLALGAADLDGDALPELYFANDFGPDALLHNRSTRGSPRFVSVVGRRYLHTPSSKTLGRDSFKGMGVDFADVNGDGWLDIFVSNIAEEFALEESHFVWVSTGNPQAMRRGVAPYADHSEAMGLSRSGWAWDSRWADFDNDGVPEALQATGFVRGSIDRWPELHEIAMGNDRLLSDPRFWHRFLPGDDLSGQLHNPFFVRGPHGRYVDLAPRLSIDQRMVSRGIATADVDGDGDLDFAVANQWEPSFYYRNDGSGRGRSLTLLLHLPAVSGSTPAIGARAVVRLPDGRRLTAQVDGGNGHSGTRSSELHFGLGRVDPELPLEVDLSWRGRGGGLHRQRVRLQQGRHEINLEPKES